MKYSTVVSKYSTVISIISSAAAAVNNHLDNFCPPRWREDSRVGREVEKPTECSLEK